VNKSKVRIRDKTDFEDPVSLIPFRDKTVEDRQPFLGRTPVLGVFGVKNRQSEHRERTIANARKRSLVSKGKGGYRTQL